MSKVTIYSPPSAAQVKNCTADFDLRRAPVPIHLVQFDKTIPILAVALYKGGTAYKLPEDAEANVRMGKRNNLYVYNPVLGCNEGRTLVYVAVTPQMTTQDGVFYPILEVLAGGGVAGTSPLQLVIQRNPVQEGDLEDTSEAQTLADLVNQAAASANAAADSARIVQENKDAIQSANENIEAIKAAPANATAAAASAKEARSWAVGDTASRPGEGMDNAKYYAALAQQVSQGAVGWYPNYEALYAAHDTGYDGNWAIIGDTDTIWVWDSDTGVWKDTGESSKFANYYDKTQIDENFYDKTQIDANFYGKTQIDENFYDKTQIDANFYNKTQIDLSNYYQKQEADARFQMPIGYVFEWASVPEQSVDLSTPEKVAQYFGYGTWAAFGAGQFLLGAGGSYQAGNTGGEAEHTLTKSELPNEPLSIKLAISGASGAEYAAVQGFSYVGSNPSTLVFGNTDPLGSGDPMNIMPPYIVVYRWQRIA